MQGECAGRLTARELSEKGGEEGKSAKLLILVLGEKRGVKGKVVRLSW